MLLIVICMLNLSLNIEWQGDWSGGMGTFGTVSKWGNKFWQSESLTYNVQGQICPVGKNANYTAWVKHIIDTDANIQTFGSIAQGDFDRDGDQDIAGVKGGASQLVFYENVNDIFVKKATFSAPGGGGADVTILSVAYINKDSLIDVVVSGGSGIVWFENSGGFNFTSHTISSVSEMWFNVTGDIDNDGDIDIVEDCSGGDIKVWKNDGVGNFTNTQTIVERSWRLRLDDLNGDGTLDLMIDDGYINNSILIYFNNGSGNFSSGTSLGTISTLDGLWSRDFDNDGDVDILTSMYISWWENNGTGYNYTEHKICTGSTYGDGCSAEDIDMDGKADVIAGYYGIAFFQQNTLTTFTQYVIDNSGNTHWVIPFFRGGCIPHVDILVSGYGEFLWYENNMVNEFASGWLESSVLKVKCDSGNKCDWKYFGWKVCCPFYKAIMFQIRSGKDSADITGKDWSDAIKLDSTQSFDSVDIATYTKTGEELFQYRINFMGASDVGIVDSVWVTWECSPFGVEEKVLPSEFVKIYQNKICYYLPSAKEITLSLYDITGRLVKTLDRGKKSGGYFWIDIPSNIRSGVYLIKFTAEKRTITRKLVVIRTTGTRGESSGAG